MSKIEPIPVAKTMKDLLHKSGLHAFPCKDAIWRIYCAISPHFIGNEANCYLEKNDIFDYDMLKINGDVSIIPHMLTGIEIAWSKGTVRYKTARGAIDFIKKNFCE
jgi:hypothetical protein